jgi:hypothetical protein
MARIGDNPPTESNPQDTRFKKTDPHIAKTKMHWTSG